MGTKNETLTPQDPEQGTKDETLEKGKFMFHGMFV
jgi:hypothetical protein